MKYKESELRRLGNMEVVKKDRSGIYLIYHGRSKRWYVGQAQDIKARWAVHLATLQDNKHHCSYLQRVWNKYGALSIYWEVLEYCKLEELNIREQFWMDNCPTELMNLQREAGSARGYKHSEESRKAMSEVAKRIGQDPEERKRRSERCKKQHQEGRIGYRQKIVKYRTCKDCENEFLVPRIVSGCFSGTKWCDNCRPPHKGGRYKTAIKPEVRVLNGEGRPKQLYRPEKRI